MKSKPVPQGSAGGRQQEKRGFGKKQSLQSVDCRLCMFRNAAWMPFGRSQIDAAALLVVDDIVGLALFGLYVHGQLLDPGRAVALCQIGGFRPLGQISDLPLLAAKLHIDLFRDRGLGRGCLFDGSLLDALGAFLFLRWTS